MESTGSVTHEKHFQELSFTPKCQAATVMSRAALTRAADLQAQHSPPPGEPRAGPRYCMQTGTKPSPGHAAEGQAPQPHQETARTTCHSSHAPWIGEPRPHALVSPTSCFQSPRSSIKRAPASPFLGGSRGQPWAPPRTPHCWDPPHWGRGLAATPTSPGGSWAPASAAQTCQAPRHKGLYSLVTNPMEAH